MTADASDKAIDLWREVRAVLATWRTASIATVDDAGLPHAANVQFAVMDDGEAVLASRAGDAAAAANDAPAASPVSLIFVSSPNAAHSQHIAARKQAALTIYAHVESPEQIHGLQMHGLCRAVTPTDHEHALQTYLNRFTFIRDNPALQQRIEAEQLYQFTPTWLRWIDNRQSFGFKRTWP